MSLTTRLILTAILLVGIISVTGQGAEGEKDAAKPKVTGNIATRVEFKDAASEKVAEAAVALLASCRHKDGELVDWDHLLADTANKCFLRIRLPKPRSITVNDDKLEVRELLVLLPLNTGSIYVRSGGKARRFAKYDHQVCVRLQELLKRAELAK
jgi:hypothetical protein